jgi:hypothetical protein
MGGFPYFQCSIPVLTYRWIRNKLFRLAPTIGAIVFLFLYVVSTFYYPGGSQFDARQAGFSWQHNYWCNLLDAHAINGKPNPAQPIAVCAMLVLCGSLIIFWWQFSTQPSLGKLMQRLVRVFGSLAIVFGFFC